MAKRNGRGKKKRRRVQYSPEEVVLKVLYNDLLYRVAEILFESDVPIHASDVARGLGISIGYASSILRKFEKWKIAKCERDPVNGKLMYSPSDKKVAELLREEIVKRKRKGLEESILHKKLSVEL